jgi:glycosyltransferase involved in cell wall biosynthesis
MIAICTPNPDTPAETFVRQHIRLIAPGNTAVVYFEGNGKAVAGIPAMRVQAASKSPFAVARRVINYFYWGYPGLLRGSRGAEVEAFLRAHKVEAVLAEFGPTGCSLLRICKRLKLPLVVNFHGHDATVMPNRRVIRRAYRELNKRAAGFICGSEHFKQILVNLGFDRAKIHVVPCGIELNEFTDVNTEKDPSLVLAVGRFVEKKSPDLTVKAFRQVVDNRPDARLEMIGDGPLFQRCEELVEQLGLTDHVILHGLKDHDFVKARMKKASIFVQHSVTASNGDQESQGVSLLEALASSTPQVVTDHNGFRETVADSQTGFLVAEKDIGAMATRIVQLLEDGNLRERFGKESRKRAQRLFEAGDKAQYIREILNRA